MYYRNILKITQVEIWQACTSDMKVRLRANTNCNLHQKHRKPQQISLTAAIKGVDCGRYWLQASVHRTIINKPCRGAVLIPRICCICFGSVSK